MNIVEMHLCISNVPMSMFFCMHIFMFNILWTQVLQWVHKHQMCMEIFKMGCLFTSYLSSKVIFKYQFPFFSCSVMAIFVLKILCSKLCEMLSKCGYCWIFYHLCDHFVAIFSSQFILLILDLRVNKIFGLFPTWMF